MPRLYGSDASSSKENAGRIESAGGATACLPLLPMAALDVLADPITGLGALFFQDRRERSRPRRRE